MGDDSSLLMIIFSYDIRTVSEIFGITMDNSLKAK